MATKTIKPAKEDTLTILYLVDMPHGSTCCQVRNERGDEYRTCVHANGRTSCVDANGDECRGHKFNGSCYHSKRVVKAVDARAARKAAAAPVAPVVAAPTKKAAPVVKGNLNGQRGFQLMR